ncbi:MAG: VWA domain-containing protein [Planctomycetes bacterium]|nr:VWA domain-containing protein [Planctomycetota bacterium]MCW8135291.1 VWA domain-containing protein [Planctomycetota bacterium]
MRRLLFAAPVLFLIAFSASAQNATSVALLGAKEPSHRVEGAKRLIKDGDKKSVAAVLKHLVTERDGFAGREIGRQFKELKDKDGLQQAERTILGFKKSEEMFAAYWALSGIAEGATEQGDALLKSALTRTHAKEVSLASCALEAIGESGRIELAPLVLPILESYTDDKGNVFETLSALTAARKLCPKDGMDAQKPYLMALINVLEKSQDDRIQYFAALGLSRITGKPAYLDGRWWRNWILKGDADEQQGKSVAAPTFFDTVAVGKRVLFVIDISGSMDWPAEMGGGKGPVTGKQRDKGPDYSGVRTKLDLAKVELLWSLENLPEDFFFNIVTYETKHQMIDVAIEGLIPANAANKKKMTDAVRALRANGGTNIHGSLTRAFKIVRKGTVKDDPSLDRTAMLEGVDTIFFLTDGSPSWCDESTDYARVDPKWGAIGNGRFCEPDNILADISRINTFRKVVIHGIALGKDANKDLMRKLAEQNHGNYAEKG